MSPGCARRAAVPAGPGPGGRPPGPRGRRPRSAARTRSPTSTRTWTRLAAQLAAFSRQLPRSSVRSSGRIGTGRAAGRSRSQRSRDPLGVRSRARITRLKDAGRSAPGPLGPYLPRPAVKAGTRRAPAPAPGSVPGPPAGAWSGPGRPGRRPGRAGPGARRRSASAARTTRGVLSPWARSAVQARARSMARSWASSRVLTSSARGRTSSG